MYLQVKSTNKVKQLKIFSNVGLEMYFFHCFPTCLNRLQPMGESQAEKVAPPSLMSPTAYILQHSGCVLDPWFTRANRSQDESGKKE